MDRGRLVQRLGAPLETRLLEVIAVLRGMVRVKEGRSASSPPHPGAPDRNVVRWLAVRPSGECVQPSGQNS